MATLEKIRSHGALLVSIIAFAMFAFIIGDFLSSGSTYFNRRKENVGEIEGNKIHYTEYEAAKNQIENFNKMESGRTSFDEDEQANMRNQAWQMMVVDYAMQAQAEKIGMTVTSEELGDICYGNHISPFVSARRMFAGQDGQFNRQQLMSFMHLINMDAEEAQENGYPYAVIEQYKDYWKYIEKVARISLLQNKYMSLMGHLVTANKLEAKYAYEANQTLSNVEFVGKPYFAVADSLVNVTPKQLSKLTAALYQENKKQYKQEPNRGIQYVAYDIVPSEADFEKEHQRLVDLSEEFATTEDVMTVVNVNSDVQYAGQNLSEQQVPEFLREFAFGKEAKAGNVTEVEFDAASNTYYIARLMEAGYSAVDSVRLAIVPEEGDEQEVGWVSENMVPEEVFAKSLAGKVGSTFAIPMGDKEQTIKILEKSAATPKVKLAILARQVTASSATYATIYNQAKQFVIANSKEEAFVEAAKEAGMQVYTASNLLKVSDKVAGLKSSRPIVRWAFEAKKGEVSDVFECGNQFIVAALSEIHDGEYRDQADVEMELRMEAMKNEKAKYLAAQLKDVKTLEEAAKLWGEEIHSAEGINFSSYSFGAAGPEAALIGAAVALNAGETSAPIQAEQGVYMVRVTEKTANETEYNEQAMIQQMNMRTGYMLQYQLSNSLIENAQITDNRANFQ